MCEFFDDFYECALLAGKAAGRAIHREVSGEFSSWIEHDENSDAAEVLQRQLEAEGLLAEVEVRF